MTRRRLSRAEQCRAAREAFEAALTLNCMPSEAAKETARRRAHALRACGRRFPDDRPATASSDAAPPPPRQLDFDDWRAPWMMRD